MPGVQVLFHRLAITDYRAAWTWYSRRSPALAAAFHGAVGQAAQKIGDDPNRWPTFRARYRWVRTPRFPYILYYHVLDDVHVLVMAVAHARRRPGYWLRRSTSGK